MLRLAFNELVNYNFRDLANKMTIINVLDIRGNKFTNNVAKSFPLLQAKQIR